MLRFLFSGKLLFITSNRSNKDETNPKVVTSAHTQGEFWASNLWGTRDGALARAPTSHQCGLGWNPGIDAVCGLSLLLVLSLAPRGFSPGTLVFPFPRKPTLPNSNSTRNQVDEEPLCGCATSKSLFIHLFILQSRVPRSDHLDLSLKTTICIAQLRYICAPFYCCCASVQANYLSNLFRIQIRNCLFIVLTYIFPFGGKRIAELVSCFISSLAVKVIKYRFVAAG